MGTNKKKNREKAFLAWALASVAGFIDAVGYLTLHHLFTAHMSGNSARLGVFVGQLKLQSAVPMVAAVLLFIFGIAASTTLVELATRRGIRSISALLLAVQAAMIVAFMAYGSTIIGAHGMVADHSPQGFYVLAALAIFSIGFQACSLQRVAGERTRTAYVSGMLTKFAQESVNWLFWLHDGEQRTQSSYLSNVLRGGSRSDSLTHAMLFGGIWCFYIGGAIAGSYTHSLWLLWALACPLALLATLIALDLWRPVHAD
ncbi:MAG TPA: YoaK family protein [Gammaproteobacteria bacterium]|nr:YoaK family protein [Gammaproteobacteria bacterium]